VVKAVAQARAAADPATPAAPETRTVALCATEDSRTRDALHRALATTRLKTLHAALRIPTESNRAEVAQLLQNSIELDVEVDDCLRLFRHILELYEVHKISQWFGLLVKYVATACAGSKHTDLDRLCSFREGMACAEAAQAEEDGQALQPGGGAA